MTGELSRIAEQAGTSLAGLALLAGIPVRVVQDLDAGSTPPTSRQIRGIADALALSSETVRAALQQAPDPVTKPGPDETLPVGGVARGRG